MPERDKIDREAGEALRVGDRPVSIRYTRRIKDGLRITVKAHPDIEEMIKGLGDGSASGVEAYGRMWYPVNPDIPLKVWNSALGGGDLAMKGYRMDIPGKAVLNEGELLNLSFLRLVGIGKPEGLTFGVRGVYSKSLLTEMKQQTDKSLEDLYVNYVRTVDITVVVTTEVRY